MSKTPSLETAMKPFDKTPAPRSVPAQKVATRTSWIAPSREGKKALISYHDPAVTKQMKQLALDLDRDSIQSLIEEALDDLFQKYRKPTIARKPA